MATTVQPTTRERSSVEATAATPWYRDRNRQLVAGAVAVIVVALVAWLLVSSSRRKEAFAANSLNQARAAAEAGNLPLASSELQKLIQTYKGTDAANEAVITLNQVRMVNGQSELAAVGLREYLATKPKPEYAAPAYGLLGSALENSKKWPDAGEAFASASKAADVDYLKARYLVDAGRAYREAGKLKEAEAAYREVIQKYPKSTSLTEAQVRLAELTDGKM
ncbi:MAG TPA: tetratricopeptide repeat protein [Gemmatimonadales bacterium]|nr:tetratricopeptide repeat protein [Gemmatimonadales bacterium]